MKPQIPLCNSTMCQRMCMGTFVMTLVANWVFGCTIPVNIVALVTIVILGIGMLGTMSHLGKPGRFLGALRNPTSHLSLEMLTCIPVGICYLILGLNGLVYAMPEAAVLVLEVIGLVASVAFIWVTALAYRMKARPAWDNVFTPLNFMLTFLSGGAFGAVFAAIAADGSVPVGLLATCAVLFVAAMACQLFFTYFVSRVGYRIDVHAFGPETRGVYSAWVALGVVVPVIGVALLFAMPDSLVIAAVLMLCYAASLALWQAFFFMTGKEVWYFPQYEKDLSPAYF